MTVSRAILFILAITAFRILLLAFDRTDLFVDESQYWMWSRDLAFGYYSKPPMIAWIINLTTSLGHSDQRFWIRLSSPIVHAATAGAVMALARTLKGSPRIAAWSGVTFVTLPGVALSSVFISTDTFLLLFYALAALATVRLTSSERPQGAWLTAVGLGFALGLGLLSKYAMFYFPVTAALAALVLPSARFSWRHAALAAVVAVAVVSPNLAWNATHGAATLRHTSDNIGWSGLHFHLGKALEFFGAQAGVVGPLVFGAMVAALFKIVRGQGSPTERHLVLLSWPILGLIILQALMSRAYANWAATAYIAGVVLAVMFLDHVWKKGLWINLAINGTVSLALPLLCVFPQIHVPGQAPLLDRYLGRSALSRDLAEQASAHGVTTIVSDNRDILADLVYTLRDQALAIRAKPTGQPPRNAYEQDRTYDMSRDDSRVLLVTDKPFSCSVAPIVEGESLHPSGFLKRRILTTYVVDGRCLTP